MKRIPFEYFKPGKIEDVFLLLNRYKEKAKPIAGGTDLLVQIKKGEVKPECLVDISGLSDLTHILSDAEGIRIGALTTLRDLETSQLLKEKAYVLAEAAHMMAGIQVRNVATIGGNICRGVPSADIPPVLIALEAKAKIAAAEQERVIPLEEFFIGAGKTALNNNELLVEIIVPHQPPRTGTAFLKLGRLSVDIALVNVAVKVSLEFDNDICEDVRIVMGAVAPIPMRARKAEEWLRGKNLETSRIEEVALVASAETKPISDVRSSANYRREMSRVLVKRGLEQALERTKRGGI